MQLDTRHPHIEVSIANDGKTIWVNSGVGMGDCLVRLVTEQPIVVRDPRAPVAMAYPIKPPRVCTECGGIGYALFEVNRIPWLEIERNDACDCLATRCGKCKVTDSDAAEVFVFDLERGVPAACEMAARLATNPANPDGYAVQAGEPSDDHVMSLDDGSE